MKLWNILIAGGGGYGPIGTKFDDILEYDPVEDSVVSVGHMLLPRTSHAVNVVQVQDYAQWCLQWLVPENRLNDKSFFVNWNIYIEMNW